MKTEGLKLYFIASTTEIFERSSVIQKEIEEDDKWNFQVVEKITSDNSKEWNRIVDVNLKFW